MLCVCARVTAINYVTSSVELPSVVPLIVLINCVTEREFNYAHMFARIY